MLLRIFVAVLLAAVIGVAVIPLLVLRDLNEGGNGWGLCVEGLAACRNSYFDGFELMAILTVVIFVLVGAIAVCVRLIRRFETKPHKSLLDLLWRLPRQM